MGQKPNAFCCFQSEKDIIFDNELFPSCGTYVGLVVYAIPTIIMVKEPELLRTSPILFLIFLQIYALR